MDGAFHGFPAAVFAWFAGLERDNSRAYFAAHRECYETDVRGGLDALLHQLGGAFGGEPRVFAQHRDLRFTTDKTPYKTRTYGVLSHVPGVEAGLYAELSARGLYAGTGYHGLGRDQLDRFRSAVADDRTGHGLAEATERAVQAGLELAGQSLQTAPRGYPIDHPRIALLRHTALIAGRRLTAPGGISRDDALNHVAETWRAAAPLNAWLDEHVGPSIIPAQRARR